MSTNHRDQVRELARSVGTGLNAYIEVHDAIFRDAQTFGSVLRNLFGRGVPMSKLLADAEGLLPFWSTMHQRLQDFRQASYPDLSADERRYFDLLSHYVEALQKTVAALIGRQRLLKEGSKGRRENPMTWDAFQENERAYQMAVQEYMTIGARLNEAAPIIFE